MNDQNFDVPVLSYLYNIAESLIDFKEIREGDTIRFLPGIRNDYILLWNGTNLEALPTREDEILDDDSGNLSSNIIIQNYPLVDYFRYTIAHNQIVWLQIINCKLLYKIGGLINKWETSDGYIVYSTITDLKGQSNIHGNPAPFDYLTGDTLVNFDEHIERYNEDFSEKDLKKLIKQVRKDVTETLNTNRLLLRDSDFEVQ